MSSKSSAADGASGYSPKESTLISTGSANPPRQTPPTDHSYRPGAPMGLVPPMGLALVPVSREGPSQGPRAVNLVKELRNECISTQQSLQSLNQAIHKLPGIPGKTADLIGNDLTCVGHQVVTISSICDALARTIDEDERNHHRSMMAEKASHEAYQGGLHKQLAKANVTIDDLQNRLRSIDKNSKGELEAKAQKLNDKVNNQKRRINEQQAQIETLKRKLSAGSKLNRLAIDRREDAGSPPSEFPHSATSELTYRGRRSPPVPQPKMGSSITQQDQEFLLNNLRSNIDGSRGFPPYPGATRMERDNYIPGGPAAASSLGHFGHQLPGPVGPNKPMVGTPGYYGPYPPAPAYGQHIGGHPPGPTLSQHTFGMTSVHPSVSLTHPRPGPPGYANRSQHSTALVTRQEDDPKVTSWRETFEKLFNAAKGWTEGFDEHVEAGAVHRVGQGNFNLWTYILTVANCYKNPQSAPGHAQFLLTDPDHRTKMITRLVLQYLEQEVLRPKFWLGWDDRLDAFLQSSVFPALEKNGTIDQRRVAFGNLRSIVDQIVNSPEYEQRRDAKMKVHAKALSEIAGSFYQVNAQKQAAIVGLHSIAKIAIELSAKMMQSRLSFSFIWNDCGVKFTHDSHIAINEHDHDYALQYNKHMRVALVVTPGVTYKDENGPSILTRSLFKANVMVMQ